jgi:hypothetical protein
VVQRVAALAARQYGVVTRAQLGACGLSASGVDRGCRVGHLVRLHAGVYAVGHAVLVPDGRRLAAVLACGALAALSDEDAGALVGLGRAGGTRFHVTVPRGAAAGGRRPGIHVHRRDLVPLERAVVHGIPCTSLWRTVVDIAGRRGPEPAKRAINAIFATDRYDQAAVDAQLALRRRGTPIVREILATRHPDAHLTKSPVETLMLDLLDAHGLPRPEVNARLNDLRVEPDLLWRDERFVVELDSRTYHSGPDVFESDRAKTVILQTAGYEVRRFTRAQVEERPEWVIANVRAALFGHISVARRR